MQLRLIYAVCAEARGDGIACPDMQASIGSPLYVV